MAKMNASIPQASKRWTEAAVAEGRYSSTSNYIRGMVRRDQEAQEAKRRLQTAIDEGFASPGSTQSVDGLFGELLAKGLGPVWPCGLRQNATCARSPTIGSRPTKTNGSR